MDHFGIGVALQGAANIYFQSARRTGRTISLVESLRDGDRVVFATAQEAQRVSHMCLERKVNIQVLVINPQQYDGTIRDQLMEHGTPQGRLLFDHTWVERYYLQALEASSLQIDRWQRELGGFGEAHLETRRRAEELARWRL